MSSELRTVVCGRLYSIVLPYHSDSPDARLWREEIIEAGPHDGDVVRRVGQLESAFKTSVVWVFDGPEGRERLATHQVAQFVAERRRKQAENAQRYRQWLANKTRKVA